MDFELSEDQGALGGLVRAIVDGRFSLDRVRRAEGARTVFEVDDWAVLGEAGVFSLTLPESVGGAGLGLADATVVFEELGRGLVPGPLVASHLAARHLGLEGAADGSVVVGEMRDTEPWLVEHFDSLGSLVIHGPEGSRLLDADGLAALDAVPVRRSLDPLTPLSRLASPPGGAAIDPTAAACWVREARILVGALSVGIAAASCDLAVDYAKGRQQFGRPIGSFQAVKHLCADMLVRTETARAAVQAAAVTVDQPDVGDPDRLAAGGALLASEAAMQNAKTCIQIHGGMGFTWEVPAHLFLMRARILASSLGPPDDLAALVAAGY